MENERGRGRRLGVITDRSRVLDVEGAEHSEARHVDCLLGFDGHVDPDFFVHLPCAQSAHVSRRYHLQAAMSPTSEVFSHPSSFSDVCFQSHVKLVLAVFFSIKGNWPSTSNPAEPPRPPVSPSVCEYCVFAV
jgi:hypothetical protein